MIKHARRRIASLAALVALAGLPLVLSAAPAGAVGADVTNEVQIRAAFTAGNSPITLLNDINLSTCSGFLGWSANADLTIQSDGTHRSLTVDGACNHSVIFFGSATSVVDRTITVHDLTISGGKGIGGGAIQATINGAVAPRAHIVVEAGSVITGNTASESGGGLFTADGSVTIDHSTVTANQASASGGGIAISDPTQSIIVRDSTISGNTAGFAGGGIHARGLTIERSTISGNTALFKGGGVNVNDAATIVNSTIVGNTVTTGLGGDAGGGVFFNSGPATVTFSTIVGNTAPATTPANVNGGGATTVTFFGSVVALPQTSAVNCAGIVTTTNGYNFEDVDDCGFGTATGDHDGEGDPVLVGLANNGGPTQTTLPTTGSPLRNVVPPAACTAALATDVDQRGVVRPAGVGCEIGAAERATPSPPTGVSWAPNNGQATVTFGLPASSGESPVIGYLATCTPSSGPIKTGSSLNTPTIIVSSMTNGTVYSCTMHATNQDGPGAESFAVNVTPRTVPSAPTGVSAAPGNGQMSVSFTPGFNGGASVTLFTVTESPENKTGVGGSSPITVTGLTNEIAHTFVVKATNVAGTGPDSAASAPATSTAPGAPTGVSATPGNHQMSVAFTPPSGDGGAITSFTVTATPGGATASGATSPIIVTGLANNLAYTFKVKATNAVGTGPESAASAPKTTVFQPDVMARKSTSPVFTDLNAYTVANTAATTVKSLKSVTFVIRLFNDGTATDTINLKAALSGNNKLSYSFRDGPFVLSNLVTTGRNYTLAPGGLKQITVVVKANSGTPLNANRTATLTSRSLLQTNKLDQVKVKVTRN